MINCPTPSRFRIDAIKQNYMALFYDKNNYLPNRFSLRAISGSKLAAADRKIAFGTCTISASGKRNGRKHQKRNEQ